LVLLRDARARRVLLLQFERLAVSDMTMTDEQLQRVFDGIPAHNAHPMRLSMTNGMLIMRGTLDTRSARGEGMDQLHGGVIAALLDTAATLVLDAVDGETWSTVDLRVDYLRPVPLGPCRVEASVVRAGRRVARSTASLYDDSSRLCATATGAFVR
jgi:uncharacterized protein (TIGR00369 family)